MNIYIILCMIEQKIFDSGEIRTRAISDWCLKPAP